jgi:cation diffusion facilitator family transporter
MADGSSNVVYAALAGNVAIAIAKLVAFTISGSSAMLTESIHSFVDSIDQMLLLLGQSRARKRRDGSHPLGYGMETYFWSFVVALMVFGIGGLASIYEGVLRILHPEPSNAFVLNLTILALAAVFEGSSFAVARREYKRVVKHRDVPLWRFILGSKDPSLYATLLEDGAALTGIGIAAASLLLSRFAHVRWADGAASVLIGLLLVAVSFVLADETRSLIAGEAVSPVVLDELKGVLAEEKRIERVDEVATLHLGPKVIMVALTIAFPPHLTVRECEACVRDVSRALKTREPRVEYVYVRPGPAPPA